MKKLLPKKIALILFLLCLSEISQAQIYDELGFVGIGLSESKHIFVGEESSSTFNFLLYYDNAKNRKFAIDGPNLYVPVFNFYKTIGIGLKGFYRANEGFTEGNQVFKDAKINPRGNSLDGGIYLGNLTANISVVSDFTGLTAGNEISLYVGPAFEWGRVILNPYLNFLKKSKNLTAYYYTLTKNESKWLGLDYYEAKESTKSVLGFRTLIKYKKFYFTGILEGGTYSKEIKDSPIVERDSYSSVLVGFSYIFLPWN